MKKLTIRSHRSSGTSLLLAGGLGLFAVAGLPVGANAASLILGDVSLNIMVDAPPPPLRQEAIVGVSPGPDFVWVGGRWDHSPHGHGQWSAPHWDRDHDGHYHQTKGEWRDDGHDSRH